MDKKKKAINLAQQLKKPKKAGKQIKECRNHYSLLFYPRIPRIHDIRGLTRRVSCYRPGYFRVPVQYMYEDRGNNEAKK